MLKTIQNSLQCPHCRGSLIWSNEELRNDQFIVNSDVFCSQCDKKYTVKDEIGYFLTDLERNDLWEQGESNLMKYMNDNPEIEQKLMNSPVSDLSPADLFFRSFVHEEREEFDISTELHDLAFTKIYTKEYNDCFQSQIKFLTENEMNDNPILDVASGKGYLVFELLKHKKNHIIMTDFSPTIMRLNYKKLRHFKLLDRVSMLVFDARKTPFKDNSIELMTSNLGLNNIEKAQGVLLELRRILSGDFYSIMHFFQENDGEHRKFVSENNLSELNFLNNALAEYKKANFSVNLENNCESFSKPTPEGKIIESGIDGIPIHDTILSWSIVHAK